MGCQGKFQHVLIKLKILTIFFTVCPYRSFDIFWILKRLRSYNHVFILHDCSDWTWDAEIFVVEKIFDDSSNDSIYRDLFSCNSNYFLQSMQLSTHLLICCDVYGDNVSISFRWVLQKIIQCKENFKGETKAFNRRRIQWNF